MRFKFCVVNLFCWLFAVQGLAINHNDTLQVNEFLQKAKEFQYQYPDSTLFWSSKANALSRSINWETGLAKAYFYTATAYRVKSKFAQAAIYFDSALNLAKVIKNAQIISYCYNSLGYIHQRMADYATALSYYHQYYTSAIGNNDTISQAIALNNIGIVHYYQKEYNQALDFYQRAVDILQKTAEGKIKIATNYNNIGTIHQEMKNYGLALEFYNKAFILHLENDFRPGLINVYNNIGSTYSLLGDYERAIDNISKSIELSKQLGDNFTLASAYNELGMVYLKTRDWNIAIENFNYSVSLSRNINADQLLLDNYLSLSTLYKRKGDFETALQYILKYNQLKDSVFSKQNAETIENLNQKFQADQLIKDNILKEKERQIDHYTNWKNWFMIIFIILLAIIIGVVLWVFRIRSAYSNLRDQKKSQEIAIHQLNEKVKFLSRKLSAGKKILYYQQSKLQYYEDVFNKLILLISGDFKGSLDSVRRHFELVSQEKLSEVEVKERAPRLLRQIQSTSSNWENLILWSKIRLNHIVVHLEDIDLRSYIDQTIHKLKGKLITKNLQFNCEIPAPVWVKADRELVHLLLNKIFNNAIQFSEPNHEIDIVAHLQEDIVGISVNKISINLHEEMMDPMFLAIMSKNSNRKDLSIATGFDFAFCEELVKLNKGRISISNVNKNSATFTFYLPKSSIIDSATHQETSA